MSDKPTQNMVK